LIGAQIDLSFAVTDGARADALLFGESQSRVLVSVAPGDVVKVVERAKIMGVSAAKIGTVGGGDLSVKLGALEVKWPVAELHDLWWNAIARAMSA
jgi:phosphoribosylformylglycinamidine synthase